MTAKYSLAIATAVVTWLALALQFGLIIDLMTTEGATVLQVIWRFFGFFTILTNILVAVVATVLILSPLHFLASARVRLATATSILMVGIVYSLALRSVWNPTGLQAVVDSLLHDVSPILFLMTWFFCDHGKLEWRDVFAALAVPIVYLAYAISRGEFDGWYAYWFLDPTQQSLSQLATSCITLVVAFAMVSALMISIDKWLGKKQNENL